MTRVTRPSAGARLCMALQAAGLCRSGLPWMVGGPPAGGTYTPWWGLDRLQLHPTYTSPGSPAFGLRWTKWITRGQGTCSWVFEYW